MSATPATPRGGVAPTVSPAPVFGTAPDEIGAFRDFAQQLVAAIDARDDSFFTARARQVTLTCRGDEQLGPCSGKQAGEMLTGITGGAWRSDATAIFTLEEYAANLDWYWSAGLAETNDEYGPGSLRPYALSWNQDKESPVFHVISTSIVDTYPTGYPTSENQREAHIFNFVRDGPDWAFVSEIAAPMSVTAADWLSGKCSECYDYWEPWQGDSN